MPTSIFMLAARRARQSLKNKYLDKHRKIVSEFMSNRPYDKSDYSIYYNRATSRIVMEHREEYQKLYQSYRDELLSESK